MTSARMFGLKILLVAILTLWGGGRTHAATPSTAKPMFQRTPQRMARGKYLVEGVAHCFECHSEKDARGKVLPGTEGGGRILAAEESHLAAPYIVVCPNITPDYATGAGSWSDQDFARAIRQGIGHDGRTLTIFMPYWNFRNLSDEDLASIVVFIRSIPPVRHPLPKRRLPSEPLTNWRPDVQPAPLPSDAPADIRRGEYLVHIGNCTGCHTSADPQNHPIPGMLFGGGKVLVRPWGTVAAPNLTQDPSGISYYDEAQFLRTIRTGHVGARALNPTMPYLFFRHMKDDDLKAIFAYLRTMPPVQHRVDNTEPPTYCPKCRNRHGYGDRN